MTKKTPAPTDETNDVDPKELKIIFAPGCFDTFDGTQDELDGLMAEIQSLISSGDLMARSSPVDMDALMEEDPELAEQLLKQVIEITGGDPTRNLH
jgi:hypothetical protein